MCTAFSPRSATLIFLFFGVLQGFAIGEDIYKAGDSLESLHEFKLNTPYMLEIGFMYACMNSTGDQKVILIRKKVCYLLNPMRSGAVENLPILADDVFVRYRGEEMLSRLGVPVLRDVRALEVLLEKAKG